LTGASEPFHHPGDESDVCSRGVETGTAYILRTAEIVSAPRYWEQNFKTLQELGQEVTGGTVLQLVNQLSAMSSPWIVCDRCIELFEVDRATARERASTYWSKGKTPAGGAGDPGAARKAALTAFIELDTGSFPLEWPQ
jgi:hypothetical protein